MERLTNPKSVAATRKEVEHALNSIGYKDIPLMRYVRLGEYEDTGLTPEEIIKLRKDRDYYKSESIKDKAKLGEIRILMGK